MMVSMSNEDAKKWFMPQSSSQQRHRPEKPLHRRGWLFDCVAQLVSLCPSTPELHSAAILLAGGTNNSLLLVCRVAQQHSAPRKSFDLLYRARKDRSITHTEAVATHQCLSWLLANCLRLLASTECASVCREAALPDSVRCVPPLTLPASLSLLFLH